MRRAKSRKGRQDANTQQTVISMQHSIQELTRRPWPSSFARAETTRGQGTWEAGVRAGGSPHHIMPVPVMNDSFNQLPQEMHELQNDSVCLPAAATATTTPRTSDRFAPCITLILSGHLCPGSRTHPLTNASTPESHMAAAPLCAHLLNSSFQVSFSDMLFVCCCWQLLSLS